MKILINKDIKKLPNESAIIAPIFADKKSPSLSKLLTDKKNIEFVNKAIDCFDFGPQEAKTLYLQNKENGKDIAVILLGLGDRKNWSIRKFTVAIRMAIHAAKGEKIKNLFIPLEDFYSPSDIINAVKLAATNLLMADFGFNKYKEVPKGGWPLIKEIHLCVKDSNSISKSLMEGIILGEEVNGCRNLSNTPGGDMTPKILAENAINEAKKNKLMVKILEEGEMKKLGMGGVLGVSRGSSEKPRFIIMEYWGAPKKQKPIVFVGKGVTFDSGGLNLKPSDHFYEMHMDMSGGAAVIHAISAVARAKLKVNVIALVPAVENMLSGSSYRPGDLLKTITGKTIEVLDTDAEGRVILADALGYADRYKPELIIDVATLTDSAMVALGQRAIALFTNEDKLEKLMRAIGEENAEPVWPLPLWDEYFEEIKGTFGDVANDGKTKYGGAITGAIFLKQFVGKYPWIHLDIAPTMVSIEGQYLAKGATGTSVRILYELAKKYSESR